MPAVLNAEPLTIACKIKGGTLVACVQSPPYRSCVIAQHIQCTCTHACIAAAFKTGGERHTECEVTGKLGLLGALLKYVQILQDTTQPTNQKKKTKQTPSWNSGQAGTTGSCPGEITPAARGGVCSCSVTLAGACACVGWCVFVCLCVYLHQSS